jgi:hypothetical protein
MVQEHRESHFIAADSEWHRWNPPTGGGLSRSVNLAATGKKCVGRVNKRCRSNVLINVVTSTPLGDLRPNKENRPPGAGALQEIKDRQITSFPDLE